MLGKGTRDSRIVVMVEDQQWRRTMLRSIRLFMKLPTSDRPYLRHLPCH